MQLGPGRSGHWSGGVASVRSHLAAGSLAECCGIFAWVCCRAKREHLARLKKLLSANHGHKLALTFLYVPNSLDTGERFFEKARGNNATFADVGDPGTKGPTPGVVQCWGGCLL